MHNKSKSPLAFKEHCVLRLTLTLAMDRLHRLQFLYILTRSKTCMPIVLIHHHVSFLYTAGARATVLANGLVQYYQQFNPLTALTCVHSHAFLAVCIVS